MRSLWHLLWCFCFLWAQDVGSWGLLLPTSHLTSETLLIWLFVGCLHDMLGPWGIWGGFWGLEVFMPHLGSQETTRCPFTIKTPHHSGTFVPINEPTLTYHYQPKSIVSIRVQSWCKQSMGLDVVSCPFQWANVGIKIKYTVMSSYWYVLSDSRWQGCDFVIHNKIYIWSSFSFLAQSF